MSEEIGMMVGAEEIDVVIIAGIVVAGVKIVGLEIAAEDLAAIVTKSSMIEAPAVDGINDVFDVVHDS